MLCLLIRTHLLPDAHPVKWRPWKNPYLIHFQTSHHLGRLEMGSGIRLVEDLPLFITLCGIPRLRVYYGSYLFPKSLMCSQLGFWESHLLLGDGMWLERVSHCRCGLEEFVSLPGWSLHSPSCPPRPEWMPVCQDPLPCLGAYQLQTETSTNQNKPLLLLHARYCVSRTESY